MRQHGLVLKQDWASFKVPCNCGLRSNQRGAYLMVCEKGTDSQFAEGGLLVHMTHPATADRLMIWRIAAVECCGMGM
ncbi:hypothetical protein HBI80_132240 [Parastagonospora nodorum]|nr:hypothetical protein HBI80_132240 [Parastagonospora nodorum]KAH5329371.1 hypothetical protein HBI11_019430 [Parastagonospora nodorum]KAH5515590.1 hypothetical protein HBI31_010540 [Parastagonospora nodorum]KAH5659437.1 hypothetical protein HBI51_002510 [Parastagonospora nodorum]KAH6226478.1 hypothetical protein HBI43_068060 [Parastagonospora nodorum]